ncbi:MAG: FtsX-like permease family protein, partial [Ferruginibacter sp.]
GSMSLRKGLMIFQFSLSLLVLIFLTAYYRQFSFLDALDPGFYSKNILTVPFTEKSKIFSGEISSIAGVEKISSTSESFGMRGSGSVELFVNKPVAGQGVVNNFYFVDAGLIPMHRLTFLAGSNFPADEIFDQEKYIVINEKSVAVLGLKNAMNAVGKTVWLNDSTQVEIKGVVRDFNDVGAARYVTPLVFRNRADAFNYQEIAVSAANKESVVQQISSVWKSLNPQMPFTYEWLDKKIASREDQGDMYAALGFIAFITITIASLGLLGLVIYTVETRQKEISVRKVIGAGIGQLVLLLSKGFLKLLLIAGLIAMPVGYILSFFFLQNFANRVPFGIGTLLVSFIFLLAIGLVTIVSNTYRASAANPVKNLRTD